MNIPLKLVVLQKQIYFGGGMNSDRYDHKSFAMELDLDRGVIAMRAHKSEQEVLLPFQFAAFCKPFKEGELEQIKAETVAAAEKAATLAAQNAENKKAPGKRGITRFVKNDEGKITEVND